MEVRVKSYDEHKCSTITAKRTLSKCTLNLNHLSEYIPIVYILNNYNEKIVFDKKEKLSFYGTNGILLSANYKGIHRGVRNRVMENMLGLDLQIFERNVHLKLSSHNLMCVGAKSIEEVETAFNFISNIIENLKENILYIQSLKEEVYIKNLKWFYKNLKNTTEEMLIFIENHHYECDTRFLETISFYIDDETSLKKKINKLRILEEPIYTGKEIDRSKSEINNSVFYSKLFETSPKLLQDHIRLYELASFLHSKDIDAVYFNINSKIFVYFDIEEEKNTNKRYKHRFSLHNFGTIRQISPTYHSEAYKYYVILVTLIKEFLAKP